MDTTESAELLCPYSSGADAAIGCLLGGMIGDALGTCTEGWSSRRIKSFAESQSWPEALMRDFIPCIHMGQPEVGYVGPPRREHKSLARCGMYSDDSDTALALAFSLVTLRKLDGPQVARQYANFFFDDMCATRFRPCTAERVCELIRDGGDYRTSGLPPHFPYVGGSFANGGAMRIWPLGIAFRSASSSDLRRAVEEAIRSSHVHPEAVDFAFAVAYAVAYAVRHRSGETSGGFDPQILLKELRVLMETSLAESRINAVRTQLTKVAEVAASTEDDIQFLRKLLEEKPGEARPGSGFDFQLASVDMLPCVFWIVCRYHSRPEEAVMRAIALGGDTDTTACMVGAIVGALHGTSWIPKRWWDGLENGQRGRDWAIGIGEQLSRLDLRETSTWGGEGALDN